MVETAQASQSYTTLQLYLLARIFSRVLNNRGQVSTNFWHRLQSRPILYVGEFVTSEEQQLGLKCLSYKLGSGPTLYAFLCSDSEQKSVTFWSFLLPAGAQINSLFQGGSWTRAANFEFYYLVSAASPIQQSRMRHQISASFTAMETAVQCFRQITAYTCSQNL